MNNNFFFSKGVFCSPYDFSGIDEDFKDIIIKTLKNKGIYGKKVNIKKDSENQIYTSFLVDIDGKSYILKITFDCENEAFNNEINFSKGDKSNITPGYICSGYLKSNIKIKFLLLKNEIGISIKEIGPNSFIDRIDYFLISFFILNNCKSENSASDYIDLFFKNHDINDDFLMESATIEDDCLLISSFSSFLSSLKSELLNSCKLKSIEGNVFCHGMMDNDSIYLYNNLFKYKNLSYNFSGNPLFDLAFICAYSLFNKHNQIILLKKYCDALGLDFIKHKPIFDDCIYVASCLILYKNIFCIYIHMHITKNPSFLSFYIYDFFNHERIFKKIRSFNVFKKSKAFDSIFHDFIDN